MLRCLETTHENRRRGSVVSRPVRGKLRAAPGQTERPVAPGRRGGNRGKQTRTDPERARAEFQRAEQKLKTKPDDVDALLARAVANFRLGDNQKALDDLQVVIGKNPDAASAKPYRCIALARLRKNQDALTELAKFQKGDAS